MDRADVNPPSAANVLPWTPSPHGIILFLRRALVSRKRHRAFFRPKRALSPRQLYVYQMESLGFSKLRPKDVQKVRDCECLLERDTYIYQTLGRLFGHPFRLSSSQLYLAFLIILSL